MSEFFNECYNTTTVSTRVPPTDQTVNQAADPDSCIGQHRTIAPKLTHVGPKGVVFPTRKSSVSCETKHLSGVKVELVDEALWKMFHAEEHEMKIISTGRALFPLLALKLSGLSPTEKYSLAVNFTNVDSAKYRFSRANNGWFELSATAPDTTANIGRRFYEHPSSPALGAMWTTGEIMFDKLRLTNDLNNTDKHMIQVSSLRKYRIQVIVTKLRCSCCHQPHVRMLELPLTDFIAVTSYRNKKITQLKIDKNPSSVAFREDYKILRASRKRKQELRDAKHACKKTKTDDVISTPVITRICSWEESPTTSCCKQSPDTLTSCCARSPHTSTTSTPSSIDHDDRVSTFLQNDVILYPQNDVMLYPQFHQCSYQAMDQLLDIPQFQLPEINAQYPRLILPGFQPPEQYTYNHDFKEFDQSYSYKYEDFTTPFQYTEWDTLYY